MASDVHSGRETVEVTGDDERDVLVGGDGSAVTGDDAPGRDAARVPDAGADRASSGEAGGAVDADADADAADAGAVDASRAARGGATSDAATTATGRAQAADRAAGSEGPGGDDAAETDETGETDESEAGTAAGVAAGTTSTTTSTTTTGDDSAAEPAVKRRRTIPILLAVAALALLLDVVSKLIVVATLSDRGPVRLPGGVLYLTLLRNSGAAFSIGESQTWLFTLIAVAVVVAILRVSRRLRSVPWACALGLLLGGALGNLGDRIFRAPGLFRGHVVDFVQFPTFPVVHYDFPVFNLADSAIVIGGCLMVLLSFLGIQPDGTRHQEEEKKDA